MFTAQTEHKQLRRFALEEGPTSRRSLFCMDGRPTAGMLRASLYVNKTATVTLHRLVFCICLRSNSPSMLPLATDVHMDVHDALRDLAAFLISGAYAIKMVAISSLL